MKFKAAGGQHFTEVGSSAEIAFDLVLTARARMAEEKSKVQKTPPSRR